MKLDFDVVIIGAGVAGMTSALYLKRSGIRCCIIEKYIPGGQINLSPSVENYPGFINISGTDLALNLFEQVKRLDIPYFNEEVISINNINGYKNVVTKSRTISAKKVIVAVGKKPRKLEAVGLSEMIGKGVSYCATCDGYLYKGRNVAVIGGSDSALEEALYLSNICNKVTIIHRKDKFSAQQIYIDKISQKTNIAIEFNSVVEKIINDGKKVSGVYIKAFDKGKEIFIDGCFVCIGYEPNTNFLKNIVKLDKNGYIKVNKKYMTSINGIYAIGDAIKKQQFQLIFAMNDGICVANECIKLLK